MIKQKKSVIAFLLFYLCSCAPSVMASNVFYFDSFDNPDNPLWSKLGRYHLAMGETKSLQAIGRSSMGLLLNKALPKDIKITFYIKMPEKDACGGFILSTKDKNKNIHFSITGTKSENSSRGARLERNTKSSTTLLTSTPNEIDDHFWHKIEVLRDQLGYNVSFDGNDLCSFEMNEAPLYLSMWSNGLGKVLFDELLIEENTYFSKDFSEPKLQIGDYMSKNWSILSGKWSKMYLPSQKMVVLNQADSQSGLILLNKKQPTEFTMTCQVKTESMGQFGIVFDYLSPTDYHQYTLRTDDRHMVYIAKDNGLQKNRLDKKLMKIYPGIWFDLKISLKKNRYTFYLDNKKMFELDRTADNKGQIGFFTENSATCVFKNPVIRSKRNVFPVKSQNLLRVSDITSDKWLSLQTLSSKNKEAGHHITYKEHMLTGGSLGGVLKPGDDFQRMNLHISGTSSAYDFNIVKNESGQFHAILLYRGLGAIPPANAISPKVSFLYRDQRNQNFTEIFKTPIPVLNAKNGIPFQLKNLKKLILALQGKTIFQHNVPVDKGFVIEVGGKGFFDIEQLDFVPSKLTPARNILDTPASQKFDINSGQWVIKGGSLDSSSMPPSSQLSIKKTIVQHGYIDMDVEIEPAKGGLVSFMLNDPLLNKVQSEIELDFSKKGSIAVSHFDKKKITRNFPIPPGDKKIQLMVYRKGNHIKWLLGGTVINSASPNISPFSSLAIKYNSGYFKISTFRLHLQPGAVSLFDNQNKAIQDLFLWSGTENIKVGLSNDKTYGFMGEFSNQNSRNQPLMAQWSQGLPRSFVVNVNLDYHTTVGLKHKLTLSSSDITHNLLILPNKTGCQLKLNNQTRELATATISEKAFLLSIYQSLNELFILVNGEVVMRTPLPRKMSQSSLMTSLSEYKQKSIRLKNFSVFDL